ncbi:hypothetical protein ACFL9T_22840 [Thermodesulfobacteriota bacterium]
MANSRDGWSKIEILAKITGAIFLPIVLLVLGNWYTNQQRIENEANREREKLSDSQQRNADRVTNLLRHLASPNQRERVLAIKVSQFLAQEKQLPAELVPVLVEVASKDDIEASGAATEVLRIAAKTDKALVSSVESGLASIPPRVYFHVRNASQKSRVNKYIETLIKNGFVVPKVRTVDFGPSNSEIRYFRKEEKEEAKKAMEILINEGLNISLRDLSQKYQESTSIRPRHYELWLKPNALK